MANIILFGNTKNIVCYLTFQVRLKGGCVGLEKVSLMKELQYAMHKL